MDHFEYPISHIIQDALILLSPIILSLIGIFLLGLAI